MILERQSILKSIVYRAQYQRIMTNWIKLRQELYDQVQANVKALLGPMSAGLRRYQRQYEDEFKGSWKPVDREHLIAEIEKSTMVLVGDFHALQQSQKAQLRILKALSAKKKRVLCVEFVEARDQKHLDRYQEGKLSDKEFLKAVQWKKKWGFPWDHYKPIFKWAIKNKVKIYGINSLTEVRTAKTLNQRDQFSAQVIADVFKEATDAQFIVIYGDLHLAEMHLPLQLKKLLGNKVMDQAIVVLQNSERIYFQMLKKEIEHQVDVIALSKKRYCLQNVPPWVKWQNYLLYLEQQYDQEIDDELDFTDYVAKFAKIMASELETSQQVDDFSIYSSVDDHNWGQIVDGLSEQEVLFVKSWIAGGRSFFVPQNKIGYLARGTVNSAAQLAMGIVSASLSGQKDLPASQPNDFTKLIWLEAIQYFGSKMINPKRKTDTLVDVRAALAARSPIDKGREALQLAIGQKMQELLVLSGQRKPKDYLRKSNLKSYQEAGRILGGMLGEKLYFAYRKKILSKRTLLSLLRKSISDESFKHTYWEILEVIESFPEPFQSKSDKM